MKKYILSLLLVSFTSLCVAQAPDTLICDAPDRDTTELESLPWFGNNDYLENLLDSIGYPSPNFRIVGTDRVRYHVPIKFWVYRNSAGVGGPNQVQLQNYIDNLNRFYNVDNNTLIGFYMKCDVGFIDDIDHLEVGDVEAWLLIQGHKEPGAINIHITDDLKDAAGVHYRARFFGVDAIFLNADTYNRPELASTIAHEVGHYFELDHTHQYENRGKCRKEAIDRNKTWGLQFCFFGGGGGSNTKVCETTGDLLRDTPADHDLSTNNSCNYVITGQTDPWGDHYETPPAGSLQPDTRNILSYNRLRGCRDVFSRLQIAVMIYSIERGKSSGNKSSWKDSRAEYDEYEPDNNSVNARPIVLGETQERNFHQQHEGFGSWIQCDVDWVRFVPTCSGSFAVQTSAIAGRTNANTRLTLFDNTGLNQLAQNDDISTSNLFSSLSFNFVAAQTYFIRIENISANVTGYYNLSVGPQFAITGSSTLCISGNYSINNLPAGASVVWGASPGIVQFSCNPCSTTNVSRVNDGMTTLTATVTSSCFPSPLVLTQQITVGSPYIAATVYGPDTAFSSAGYYFHFETIPWNLQVSNITWTVPSGWSITNGQGGTITTIYTGTQSGDVQVHFDDGCGTTWGIYKTVIIGSGGGIEPLRTSGNVITVSVTPNPATDNVKVTLHEKGVKPGTSYIKEIRIIDKMGMLKKKFMYASVKAGNNLLSQTINARGLRPDTYTVQVHTGNEWVTCKLVILN